MALGVVLGLVVGKLVGVSASAWLAVRLGVGTLPEGARWSQVVGIAAIAGIGFTVSLFVAELAFDRPRPRRRGQGGRPRWPRCWPPPSASPCCSVAGRRPRAAPTAGTAPEVPYAARVPSARGYETIRTAGEARLRYMPGIDGLRALAVAAVFAYHADLGWAKGGFLGVDLFFVISGFLITSLLLAEWQESGSLRTLRFWGRRALRLLPALVVVLVVVSVAVPLLASDQGYRLRGDVLAGLGYVSNWRLIFEQQSYFQEIGRPPVLQHLWSLAVEEQFYLLWPLVLFVLLIPMGRSRRDPKPLICPVLALAAVSAGLMALLYDPDVDPLAGLLRHRHPRRRPADRRRPRLHSDALELVAQVWASHGGWRSRGSGWRLSSGSVCAW